MAQTKLHQITDRLFAELYGQPLGAWVADRRGEGMTWRRIENELFAKTDGSIYVSHPTLIAWYGDTADAA